MATSTDARYGRPRAFVLGTEHPRSAAVIRSLAKAGIPADVADHYSPPTALWRASRYIRDRHLLSEERADGIDALLRIGMRVAVC